MPNALASLASAHLAAGNLKEALDYSAQAVQLQNAGNQTGEFHPQDVYWHRYKTLTFVKEIGYADSPESRRIEALEKAFRVMVEAVRGLSDPGLRRGYFHRVPINREITLAAAECLPLS